MRRSWIFAFCLLALTAPAEAQIGKRVVVRAGTPEDKALTEINKATDPAQKLALIDKFVQEYGEGEMAIAGYELYVSYYLAQKNYDKVAEYCEKWLSVDPDSLGAGVNLVRAAQETGDVEKLMAAAERVAGVIAHFKAEPPPTDTDAAAWEQQKTSALADAKDNLSYVEYAVFNGIYPVKDPSTRASLLERFITAFPGSPYTPTAQTLVATSYQQAQNYSKMLDFAEKALQRDANNLGMLLFLADYYGESGKQLDKAEQYAKKALELLEASKKPESQSPEQWEKQVSLQKGLAWSALGQVYIYQRRDAQAMESFRRAAPLLKADPVTYARNQYRMGFALLNLKRVAEAREALAEAASIDTPYRALAQEKLRTLPPGPPSRAKKRP